MEAVRGVGGKRKVKELTPNRLPPLSRARKSRAVSLPAAATPIPLSLTGLSVQEEAGWCILTWPHTLHDSWLLHCSLGLLDYPLLASHVLNSGV